MAEEKIEETKEKFIPIKVPVFKEVELKFLPWGGCRDFNNIIAYFTTEELKTKPINKDIKDRSKKMYDDFVAAVNKLGPNVYKEAFGPIETMIKYWITFCGNELCANPVSEAITMEFYRLLTKDCWDFENELVLTKQAERVTPMKLIWFGTPLIITQNYGGKSWYENFNIVQSLISVKDLKDTEKRKEFFTPFGAMQQINHHLCNIGLKVESKEDLNTIEEVLIKTNLLQLDYGRVYILFDSSTCTNIDEILNWSLKNHFRPTDISFSHNKCLSDYYSTKLLDMSILKG